MLYLFTLLAAVQAAPSPNAPAAPTFAQAAPLDIDDLDKATAREDIAQHATADQAATVSNNSVNGQSTTGTVAIDGNAFQNLSGLAIVNANTGNNVAINAALNVNVIFTPTQPQP